MSAEDNKQIVYRFYAALQAEDFEEAASMCHEDFVFYSQVDTPRHGAEGFIAAEKRNLDAFKPYEMTIDTIAEGERVAAYIVFEGDQCEEYCGIAPAGAHLRMSMLNLFTFSGGKLLEKRAHYDRLDHIQQLSPVEGDEKTARLPSGAMSALGAGIWRSGPVR